MLTPLTAETFAFRLVCSAWSVVRLLVMVALCCAWAETRLVAKSASEPPGVERGGQGAGGAEAGGVQRRLGDPGLDLGAERVVDDVLISVVNRPGAARADWA